jgi:hypothetical protein
LDKSKWLRDAVVNACADDYEDIVRIRHWVAHYAGKDTVTVSDEDIVHGIEKALSAGLIRCYELLPRAQDWCHEVVFDRSKLVEFGQYFYVTDKGKEFLLTEDTKEI